MNISRKLISDYMGQSIYISREEVHKAHFDSWKNEFIEVLSAK